MNQDPDQSIHRSLESTSKRISDLILAGVLLTVALPVIAVCAAVIRISIGSPILFRQARPGLRGRTFTLIKFRTMYEAYDENGLLLDDRQRLGRFGAFLRSASLDELPGMWNVFKGDMSLVGPRPLLKEYLPLYSAEQMRRHEMKPGLTGLAQVRGRNSLSWEERFALDVEYVDSWSLMLDLRILLQTVSVVLSGKGVSAPESATMPTFEGDPNV